jgi:hypothetical protein
VYPVGAVEIVEVGSSSIMAKTTTIELSVVTVILCGVIVDPLVDVPEDALSYSTPRKAQAERESTTLFKETPVSGVAPIVFA